MHRTGSKKSHLSATHPISIWLWHLLGKLWYPVLTRFTRNSSLIFLNYGYCSDRVPANSPALKEEDEPDRSCIQLYHHVVEGINLAGLDVLEVSCGHGGGASYIARYLGPKSVHGVDRNRRAIKLCKERYSVPGLTFSAGDAMALDFDDNTFGAVVNIEASHGYGDMPRFLREVVRILRPGGYFLYADFRHNGPDLALLCRQIAESGLDPIKHENISADVVRGMELNTDKYTQLIASLAPRFARRPAMSFAGLKGSPVYRALESGDTIYFVYALRKRAISELQQ